jgi:hypothetical protein
MLMPADVAVNVTGVDPSGKNDGWDFAVVTELHSLFVTAALESHDAICGSVAETPPAPLHSTVRSCGAERAGPSSNGLSARVANFAPESPFA